MLFNLVLQSYSQIEKLYDKEATEIKDNCQNHIYIKLYDKEATEIKDNCQNHIYIINGLRRS
nr:TraM recognition domain-containing protein [Bacillus anthracis]